MVDMNLKATLTILFGTSIAVANITASKLSWFVLPGLGGVAVPAGFVGIGVAFLCSDLLVEFYGESYAHRAVNATIAALVAAYGLVWVAIALPAAPFYQSQGAYASVLSSSAAITAASIITLAVSQHVDVRVFARLKAATDGQHKWLRNLGSTTVSQLVDTVVFITLGFAVFPALQGGDPTTGAALASIIVGQYVVKLGVAALDTPVFYVVTWATR
jgi:uncharacterized integral membrane protein (TIGR00697 family)